MQTGKTKDEGEKETFNGFNSALLGHGMFEMMKKCYAGRGGFLHCSTDMQGVMESMRKQHCCASNEDAAESERRKK